MCFMTTTNRRKLFLATTSLKSSFSSFSKQLFANLRAIFMSWLSDLTSFRFQYKFHLVFDRYPCFGKYWTWSFLLESHCILHFKDSSSTRYSSLHPLTFKSHCSYKLHFSYEPFTPNTCCSWFNLNCKEFTLIPCSEMAS